MTGMTTSFSSIKSMSSGASVTGAVRAPASVPGWLRIQQVVVMRFAGPGGIYNLGNVIGLSIGLALQLSLAGDQSAAQTALSYLTGSPAAMCMTLATLVFMVSGEAYHRAWAKDFPMSARLIWWGDCLSGVGALWLAAALFLLGQPWLAATAGVLHAAGKFGSALHSGGAGTKVNWPQVCRWLVLASRVPAIGATGFELGIAVAQGAPFAMIMPATLLACYLLWAKADVLLMDD